MPDSAIEALRSNAAVWAGMRQLSRPVYDETRAINESLSPREFATEAARIDLVIGEKNRGQAPYGRTFDDVLGLTPRAVVHQLSGQGHLAHLEAPEQLAGMIAWGIGELPTVVLAMMVTWDWLRSDTRDAKRHDRKADRDGDAELAAYNEHLARLAEHGRDPRPR